MPWGHFREQEFFVFHFSFNTAGVFFCLFVLNLVSIFGFHITLGYILCGFVCLEKKESLSSLKQGLDLFLFSDSDSDEEVYCILQRTGLSGEVLCYSLDSDELTSIVIPKLYLVF